MTTRRHPRRRRGRAALAWAAGLFLAVQLAGGLLLDYAWPDVRFPSFGHLLDHWRARPQGPDVLCLGSSRFGLGLPPSVLRAAFRRELDAPAPQTVLNAAVPLGDPIAEDFVFKRLLRAGARPALVVVEVSPETVNGYNDWFGTHIDRQFGWADAVAKLPDVCRSQQAARLAAARLVPLYVHRHEIWRRLAGGRAEGEWDDDRETGIDWQQIVPAARPSADAAAREAAIRFGADLSRRKLRYYRIGGATAASLERVLARARQRGAAVVMVGIPVTSNLRELYTPPIDAAYRDYMARLCRTYGCRFVDWRDRAPDDDFVDIYHLGDAGAVRFGRRLTEEVLAPAWREIHSGASSPVSQTASR